MRWALLAVVFPQHFILLNKILILGVSVSAVSAPTPGVHSILWCYCEQRSGRASMLWRESVGSLMMSHLYLNSSWSELLALLASSGECVLLAPTTCLLVCEVLPSSMCLGLIPGPVLTALLHRSWATSYIALHTLWALAAFSLQSWFQNQLQVRPLGPSLPAGSDMSSIMVLSTLPQCHAWERDHRTLHNIRTVTDDNEFLQTRKREGTTQTRARWTLVPLRTFHVQIREHVKRPTEAQRSAVTMTSNKRSASDVTK